MPSRKTKDMNMTKAQMNSNDMFSQGISSSINFRKCDSKNVDLKTKIMTKELEIWGLKEIMKGKDKKAKKQEKLILKKIIRVQRLEITKSLDILKTKDPKKAEKLLNTLKLETLKKENFKEKKLKTKKSLDCKVSINVEPEHEEITPRNTSGIIQPCSKGNHSQKRVISWFIQVTTSLYFLFREVQQATSNRAAKGLTQRRWYFLVLLYLHILFYKIYNIIICISCSGVHRRHQATEQQRDSLKAGVNFLFYYIIISIICFAQETIADIHQSTSTELSLSLMELGWRQYWSKSWKRPYFSNLRTGENLWSLVEVQAVTSCYKMSGE